MAGQALDFKMDLRPPHESAYSETRHMTAWRNRGCLELELERQHNSAEWEEGTSFCLGCDIRIHCHLVRQDWSGDNAGGRFRD